MSRRKSDSENAEGTLVGAEVRFRDIVDNVGEGIGIVDIEDRFIFANSAAARIFGVASGSHLIGRSVSEFLDEEQQRVVREQTTKRASGKASVYEVQVYGEDGETRDLVVTASPQIDGCGRVTGTVGIFRDITERKMSEEALRRSEEMYRTLIETMSQGVINQNADWTITAANPAAARILGVSLKELMDGTFDNIERTWMHEDGSPYLLEDQPSAISLVTGKPAGPAVMGLRHERLQSTRWILTNSIPQYTPGEQKPCAVHTIFTDITEHKLAEDALRESEHKTRSIIDSLPIGMHAYHLGSDGRLLFVGANPAADRILGVDNGVFIGKTIEEAFPPLAKTEVPQRYREAAASGKTWHTEHVDYQDGAIHGAFEVYAFQTTPNAMVAAFEDITERKQAEHELHESEARLRAVVESLSEGLIITDIDGIITYTNPQMADMCGYKEDELLGKSSDLIVPEDSREMIRTRTRSRAQGICEKYVAQLVRKDSSLFWVEISAGPLSDASGGIIGALAAVRDIAERKQAEEDRHRLERQLRQAQKLETIGTMAGGIAHDFNNILTPILAYSELATSVLENEHPVREDLMHVISAANRAKDLVRQILTFSRQAEQERYPVELSPIVKEVLKLMRASIPATVEIVQDIDPSCGAVLADPSQIHQVLMNLCANASHAMRDSGGILTVTMKPCFVDERSSQAHPELLPGQHVHLAVSDTGCGMDSRTSERAFEPFFTTKQVGEGTGLGLPVVHGIVSSHGGAIIVDSELGRGSTFHVYLPRALAETPKQTEPTTPITGGHEHILLVDDDPEVTEISKRVLEMFGYTVTTRTSSLEALELFRTHPQRFDLLLTDQTMPQMTGDRLAKEIAAVRTDIPVILMTGFSHTVDAERCRQLGINAYLMKPVLPSEMARAIRTVLDGGGVL